MSDTEHQPLADAVPDYRGPEYESLRDECRQYLPVITAYYDGEASEAEAVRARVHLRACVLCAAMLREWRQAARLLRACPVPAPPSGLLPRLLVACRLSLWPRRVQRPAELWDHDLPPLPTCDVEPSFAPRTTSVSCADHLSSPIDCPLPPNLCSDILARTVAARSSAAVIHEPLVPRRRRSMLPSTMVLTGAAAFLIMASRHASLAPPAAINLPTPLLVSDAGTAAAARLSAAKPVPALRPRVAAAPRPTSDHPPVTARGASLAAVPAAPPGVAAPMPPARLALMPARRHLATHLTYRRGPETATASLVSWRPATRPATVRLETAVGSVPATMASKPVAAAHTAVRHRAPARPARLTRQAIPDLSLATTVSLTDAPEPTHREFDAMLDEVNSIRDSRPEAASAVVDDYRAGLLQDQPADSGAGSDQANG